MALQSKLFKGDSALEKCLVRDAAHVAPGALGSHVGKIQIALQTLDQLSIDSAELTANRYGPSTAAAVLAFKKKRHIVNFSYQTHEDNIVGKMTIAALDREMLMTEQPSPGRGTDLRCAIGGSYAFGLLATRLQALRPFLESRAAESTVDTRTPVSRQMASASVSVPSLPRSLDPTERASAIARFGGSLDLTNVFISDFASPSGEPLTVATLVPILGWHYVMGCGTMSPGFEILLHQLVHVWQSQHEFTRIAFMGNAKFNQILAEQLNRSEAHKRPSVKSHVDFPFHFPFSPRAFVPGLPFDRYGTEQVSKQIVWRYRGTEPAINHHLDAVQAHMAAAATWASDVDNETALQQPLAKLALHPQVEDRRSSFTRF